MAEFFGYAIVAILVGFLIIGVLAGFLIILGTAGGIVAAIIGAFAKAFTQK